MNEFINGMKVLVIGLLCVVLVGSIDALARKLDNRLEAIEQAVLLNASAVSLVGRTEFAYGLPEDSPAKRFAWCWFDVKAGGGHAIVYAAGTNDVSILKLAR